MTRYFKHLKTGGIYELIGEGREEATMNPIVVYRAHVFTSGGHGDGTLWTRPRAEFYDGRFVEVYPLHPKFF